MKQSYSSHEQPNSNLLVDRDQNILAKTLINCWISQCFRPWTNCHWKRAIIATAKPSLKINRKILHSLIRNSLTPTCAPTPSEHNKMVCYCHTVFGNKANKWAGDCTASISMYQNMIVKQLNKYMTKYNKNSQETKTAW